MLIEKVVVICPLSSTPFIGTVFATLGLKVYFPGEHMIMVFDRDSISNL